MPPQVCQRLEARIPQGSSESNPVCVFPQAGSSLEIPTFSIGLNTNVASLYLRGSDTLTGAYREFYAMGTYSAASGFGRMEVPACIGNYVVALDTVSLQLPRYIKVCVNGNGATATAAGFTTVVRVLI